MFSILMDSYLKLEAPKKFCFHLCYENSKVFLTGYQRSQQGEISCTRVCLHQYDVTSDNLLLVLARLPALLGDRDTDNLRPPGNEAATLRQRGTKLISSLLFLHYCHHFVTLYILLYKHFTYQKQSKLEHCLPLGYLFCNQK